MIVAVAHNPSAIHFRAMLEPDTHGHPRWDNVEVEFRALRRIRQGQRSGGSSVNHGACPATWTPVPNCVMVTQFQ